MTKGHPSPMGCPHRLTQSAPQLSIKRMKKGCSSPKWLRNAVRRSLIKANHPENRLRKEISFPSFFFSSQFPWTRLCSNPGLDLCLTDSGRNRFCVK
ncbi:hypothetical protein CEXT_101371 [Caerostris extrusa]|uniref:Uncharacterized protein n=1 Tax=Caerostris extrusa TaxID=172846 RepID=A0AAV4MMM1_CAEEX|nr:hypothetical protein CEXT_101371 [Caerostris extrusa]